MSQINVLDANTINQIAAGEVIERPASVVKELVENSIDAGASAVTVEIKDGGISLIRVTDNGGGIEKDDIPLAFLRHSTSKIKSVEDLLVVSSLGFRGEALSSIASVAQIELVTKPDSALMGTRYLINGGVENLCEDIGCPKGTTMIVRNLFYNTPARRKFLKTAMTEAGYINDLIWRLSLSHPEISFKFINNNQTRLHTMGNSQFKDVVYNVYGRDIAANLLQVNVETDTLKISGFIGKPIISRGNRGYENYFINGRYIKSGVITKAIEEAYKTFIMVHKYPFTALHFTIDPKYLDVNVHPTKMEIRFNNNDEIYKCVFHGIRDALEGKEIIPKATFSSEKEERKEQAVIKKIEKELIKSQPKPPEPFETKRRESFVVKEMPQTPYVAKEAPVVNERVADVLQRPKSPMIAPSKPNSETEKIEIVEKKSIEQPVEQEIKVQVKEENVPQKETKAEQMTLFEAPLLSKEAREKHKLVGQVFKTYWIVEYNEKMFIIDQHAAHEKVLYEKLVNRYKNHTVESQLISPPIILTLSLKEIDTVNKYLDNFAQLGFSLEAFGGNEYAVRSVPMDLYGFDPKELVVTMIDALSEDNRSIHSDLMVNRLATAACKAAVKGNQNLSFKEADALIELLLQAENPYTCPHGRPTIIEMSKYDLEKKFKRIQN